MVRIKSISEEGTYYLVNGWRKHNAFWVEEKDERSLFKTKGIAERSLKHLREIMFPDYENDKFIVEEC